MSVVIGAAVVTAGVSMYSSYQSGKMQKEATEASNEQAAEQYRIDSEYYKERIAYSEELHDYALVQQEFSYTQKAYAEKQYTTALDNLVAKYNYDQEALTNRKKAGITQYNADKLVADITKIGAEEQMNMVAQDAYRVLGANAREEDRKLVKQIGQITAQLTGGLAQGSSSERASAEAYMNRNAAVANLEDKAKGTVLQTAAMGNKVMNDASLKIAQSYRELQALMKLEVPSIQKLAGPTPVFTEVPPDAPIQPVGATPAEMPTMSSGAILGNALVGGVSSGLNMYGAIKSL